MARIVDHTHYGEPIVENALTLKPEPLTSALFVYTGQEGMDGEEHDLMTFAAEELCRVHDAHLKLRMHYVGVIALLGRVAGTLNKYDRMDVAAAMEDARKHHGLNIVRAGKGWSVEPKELA